MKTPAILINYNYDPQWLKGYDLATTIYDRSDDGIEREFYADRIYKTKNVGDVDFDKLSYLVENYHNLPDVFVLGKTNLFKYVDEEYFKEKLKENQFAPLLKMDHKTYSDQWGVVCRYEGPIYAERADSWYFNNPALDRGRFHNWQEWISYFRLPSDQFVPFAPGGSYILTKERVHRHSRDLYAEMRDTLSFAMHPAEAHACERSYFYLWR